MDIKIVNRDSRRIVQYDDVVSIQQIGKRLMITDASGWVAAIRVHDGEVVVTIDGCMV